MLHVELKLGLFIHITVCRLQMSTRCDKSQHYYICTVLLVALNIIKLLALLRAHTENTCVIVRPPSVDCVW